MSCVLEIGRLGIHLAWSLGGVDCGKNALDAECMGRREDVEALEFMDGSVVCAACVERHCERY